MKNFKKIASAIAALSLAACVAVPMSATVFTASAADTTITITTGDAANHTYGAWQIFKAGEKGSVTKETGGSYVITDVQWGDGIDGNKINAVLEKIKGIDGTASDKPFADVASAADVAKVLGKYTVDDNKVAQAFADIIVGALTSEATATSTASLKTATITIGDGKEGYYLVQDTVAISGEGAKTRYILQVAGGENLTPEAKSSIPSVTKKVKENTEVDDYTYTYGSDETSVTETDYNDVADYNIGDKVPFRIYGTLPDKYDEYTTYFYEFNDTLDSQFTAPVQTDIKVYLNTVDGGKEITSNFTVSVDGNSIKVTCNNLKEIKDVDKDSVIIVDYSATLSSNATIGLDGQMNAVDLTYSNNPNYKGDGGSETDEHGKTPEDKVIVFTYEIDSTKVADNEETGAALKDAEFKLYRKTGDSGATLEYAKFEESTTGEYTFNGWTTEDSASVMKSADATGKFNMKGLDDGTYYIVETKAPSGYNKLNDPITVVINATTANRQTWDDFEPISALTGFTGSYAGKSDGSANATNGTVSGKVVNEKGATLPSTGGIGTTLFYLGGGALVAVAGVMLITKKRMTKE